MTAPDPWPFADSDAHGWPDKARDAGGDSDLFKAMLDVREKRADDAIARAAAARKFDDDLFSAYYLGAIEVAKGSLDRARASADVVQKSAAAIVTLYTGILAVAFSVTANPLPFNGIFAAVLLGLAIVLSTVFVAYLPSNTVTPKDDGSLGDPAEIANDFVAWMREGGSRRAYALRASVLALGCALFFLPAPFVGAVDVPWVGDHKPATLATNASSLPASPAWPALDPTAVQYPLALQKIVYQAQVSEIAQLRSPPTQKQSNGFWWIAFGVALAAVFGGAFVGRTATGDP